MSGKGRLVLIVGTRPDYIKVGPIAAELRARGAPFTIISTGQHTSLLDGCPAKDDLAGGLSLGLVGHPDPLIYVTRATAALQDALEDVRNEAGPISAVVVQGDTGTALAGARAAKALNLPIAHIEAGLRSGSTEDPWPEELFRREISTLADWHYAPTDHAAQHLVTEGIPKGRIFVTGNSVVSALQRYATLEHCPTPENRILISLHRREFLAKGHFHILSTLDALFQVSALNLNNVRVGGTYDGLALNFVVLVHPSLRVALGGELPPAPPNVSFVNPLDYRTTVDVLRKALGVITDSGGLTEEAATLGVPCVMLRDHTDRPEILADGDRADLLPPNGNGMHAAVFNLLHGGMERRPSSCFGTPQSASHIARHLSSLT